MMPVAGEIGKTRFVGMPMTALNKLATAPPYAVEQALKQELADAKTQLAGRKQVERAKGILMKQKNVPEDEAFQMLRRFAMDRGIKMADAASRVIEMASFIG